MQAKGEILKTTTHESAYTTMNSQTELKLQEELDLLRRITNRGAKLRVVWEPNPQNLLSGEVKGNIIRIYEGDEIKAIDTLHHEFIDLLLSQAIEPYKAIINMLIKLINEDAYKKKETAVEAIVTLLNHGEEGRRARF